MAKAAVSQEEIQLRKRARRRLVGAGFLVLVMVIVLPMILDSEPRPQAESVRVQMPALEQVPNPEIPKSETPKPPVSQTPESPSAAQIEPAPPISIQTAPTTANAGGTVPPATSAAVDPPSVSVDDKDALKPPVVIQLGAYSQPENAQQLKDALIANKIKAFSEVVKSGQVSKIRVRAGPFDSLAEAEKAVERIAKMNLKVGMEPKIVASGQ